MCVGFLCTRIETESWARTKALPEHAQCQHPITDAHSLYILCVLGGGSEGCRASRRPAVIQVPLIPQEALHAPFRCQTSEFHSVLSPL